MPTKIVIQEDEVEGDDHSVSPIWEEVPKGVTQPSLWYKHYDSKSYLIVPFSTQGAVREEYDHCPSCMVLCFLLCYVILPLTGFI